MDYRVANLVMLVQRVKALAAVLPENEQAICLGHAAGALELIRTAVDTEGDARSRAAPMLRSLCARA